MRPTCQQTSRGECVAVATLVLTFLYATIVLAGDANRLTYLDENNPYYPSRTFPKLTTPQWVGEPGVEAVVVLAIDDMRDPAKYEAYLRPILNRLKAIDGRAPVSIMTCNIDPKAPQLQQWLAEGLSLEIHTVDHPCPLLKDGDFAKAKSTYDRCVEMLNAVPGNRPVAYRMPCCDSLNTVSPRFFAEIFNSVSPAGQYLEMDTSVFNILTPTDASVPRELLFDPDGRDKFRKYVPFKSFVNTIEDYPYPYLINRLCWEFPCVVPSDWSAQHLQKPFHPDTVRDLKAALDVVVHKQGVYNLVFHPHGWIKNEQVVEIIDHAVAKHGKKVLFLTFKEALARTNRHLLKDNPLRARDGQDNGVRILDVNNDGFQDVVIGSEGARVTRIWQPKEQTWRDIDFPTPLIQVDRFAKHHDAGVHFGVTRPDGNATVIVSTQSVRRAWQFDGNEWQPDLPLRELLRTDRDETLTNVLGRDRGGRLRDIDGDGVCEFLVSSPEAHAIHKFSAESGTWELSPIKLPEGTQIADLRGRDAGLRFVDVDEDGFDDVLFSNEQRYGLHLWDPQKGGWTRTVLSGERGQKPAEQELPMIVNQGTDNGAWFHSRHLWVQNENTAKLPDLVDRRSFNDLLAPLGFNVPPKSTSAALKSFQVKPGFTIELVAAEPLVMDPIAFDWGPDGKLWVVEMADYPLGIDGQSGGRVRFLTDDNGDGKYDRSTVFLENVPYPTGVKAWRDGVLVSSAPDILFAEDTDDDGKADKRSVWLSGFNEGNQQHRVNGFEWGLDGWLYLANGDSGGTVGRRNISGRDIRVREDPKEVDTVSGQTQFGRHRTDWGDWFGNNNSNPMFHFVLADEYIRRNPHYAPPDPRVNVAEVPGAAPVYPISRTLTRFNDFDRANRFTSACSTIVYRDDLFGEDFEGNAFISEPVHNLVHREVVWLDGYRMRSRRHPDEETSEFLRSSDSWFRPTMLRTGPDGALWIADMYRLVIEHPQWIPLEWQRQLDLRAGHDRGRIYRVYPVDKKPRPIPRLDYHATNELLKALESPNGWQRDTAHEQLLRIGELIKRLAEDENEPKLRGELLNVAHSSTKALARLHAWCTLDGLGWLKPEDIGPGLRDLHPGVVRNVIRLCEDLPTLPPEAWAALREHRKLLETAYLLGERREPEAAELLGEILLEAKDPYLFAAAMSSLNKRNIETVLKTVLLQKGRDTANVNFLETLLAQAAAFGNRGAVRSILDEVSQPNDGRYADWQFRSVASLLAVQRRQNVRLVDLQPLDALFTAARSVAADADAETKLRIAALGLLGQNEASRAKDLDVLSSLLGPRSETEVQLAAIDALGRIREVREKDDRVPQILLDQWSALTPILRNRVLDTLLSRDQWSDALLAAIEAETVRPQDIDAARRQRLLNSDHIWTREQAEKVFAGTVEANRAAVVQQFASSMTRDGDAARGKQLFGKVCAQCHKLGDLGHEVGPDLAALTDKSPASLLAAMLDPNRAVEAKFLGYVALTKEGKQYDGLLAAETGNSLTLRGPEAKDTVLLRADIEELKSTAKSMMPEGLEKDLKPQDFADVIAFVRGSGPVPRPKRFASNTPQLVKPAEDGSLLLTTATCEIFGPTIVLEEKYRNLGYWASPDDHVVWLVEVPKSGEYTVNVDYACDPSAAGGMIEFTSAGRSLTATVKSTGNWDTYQQAPFGKLVLDAGPQRLIVKPHGAVTTGALIDLKSVRLVP